MPPAFADPAGGSVPLRLVAPADLPAAREALTEAQRRWLDASGFAAGPAEALALPGADGAPALGLVGLGTPQARRGGRFLIAAAADRLPPGVWRLETPLPSEEAEETALGWLLHGYRFDRYKSANGPTRRLITPEGLDAARLTAIAEGVFLTRDLVNTPACDMGPEALEQAARDLAARHGAAVEVTVGEALEAGFPLIHAVGRAAAQAPRLIDLRWGPADAPAVTLVGKGVCFDTGGLDIKPSSGMRLMKKDMGGAATALGLAHIVMARGLRVRLRVLVPAVENAVGPASFRPGDILRSRKGLTVEIGNTDAEGRLVLADAMALACEERPALMLDFATLTGAARVALGPDLPPLYTDDGALAADMLAAATRVRDPLWRMPLWDAYDEELKSPVADLDNAPGGGMAGSITAALFLRRFADGAGAWAHVDLYAWNPKAKPGRPLGGEMQAGRAAFAMLEARHGGA
jgi:leucyl aminopeptidase